APARSASQPTSGCPTADASANDSSSQDPEAASTPRSARTSARATAIIDVFRGLSAVANTTAPTAPRVERSFPAASTNAGSTLSFYVRSRGTHVQDPFPRL